MRDLITNAIDALQKLADKWDEIAATTTSLVQVEASLANVRASHDRAMADLNDQQRLLEAARKEHDLKMSAMKTASHAAEAQLAKLVQAAETKQSELDAMRTQHDQIIASMHSLKMRMGEALPS